MLFLYLVNYNYRCNLNIIMDKTKNSKYMHKCLFVIIFLMQIATYIHAELPEDQKPFYDILILKNPISSNNREELFTTNIDGKPIINKDKINKNKIKLKVQNCLLTDLQTNAGGVNTRLYRNIADDLTHVLKVQTFYKNSGKIDRLYSSVWYDI